MESISEKLQTSSQLKSPENSISLSFERICYDIKGTKGKKILKGCTGRAVPGRLLAILGTSGAGKSSLLSILSGRLRSRGKYLVSGEIKLNGKTNYDSNFFLQNSAYVLQQDLVYETLTPEETFDLSAKLRLAKNLDKRKRTKIVNRIVKELSLQSCRKTLVGGNLIRGISGGERKRVSIGNELITNPSLFFVDEPTSGLDSYNAMKILDLLLKLARSGRTVIATLHQPSSEMFRKFDDLLILSAGTILYNGPADRSIEFFDSAGYSISNNSNPAEYFLNISEINSEADSIRIEELGLLYLQKINETFRDENKGIWYGMEDKENVEYKDFGKIVPKAIEKPNFISKTWSLIIKRSIKNYFRTPQTSYIRLIQMVFFSLLCGILFFQLNYEVTKIMPRIAAIFFIVTNIAFNSTLNVVLVFPLEKPIFKNELANGMYNAVSYCLSKFLVEIPINMFFTMLYQVISYFMVGLAPSASRFFLFYLVLMTTSQISYVLGMVIGALSPSSEIAMVSSSFVLLPSMLFAGFFINPKDMQPWISWATYANYFRYAIDLLVYIEFSQEGLLFSPSRVGNEEQYIFDFIKNISGEQVLQYKGIDQLDYYLWYGILLIFLFFYGALTILSVIFTTRKSFGSPLKFNDEEK